MEEKAVVYAAPPTKRYRTNDGGTADDVHDSGRRSPFALRVLRLSPEAVPGVLKDISRKPRGFLPRRPACAARFFAPFSDPPHKGQLFFFGGRRSL
jgi:hypothetical protein